MNMNAIKLSVMICVVCLIGTTLSSCENEETKKWSTTSVSYMLTMSPDLLKFVSPEVTYVDSKGEIRTVSGV